MDKLLIICGPTATWKTRLGLKLAKQFNGELVSADSRQVYKGLNVLTGKDLPKNLKPQTRLPDGQVSNLKIKYKNKTYQLPIYEINGIPIWMYDVIDFDEGFSVSHYEALARQVITEIWRKGKLPIVVGGTGLYLRALTQELPSIHIPPSASRSKLSEKTLRQLQRELQHLDPVRWQNMNRSDRANPRRLVRAVETARWFKTHPVRTKTAKGFRDVLWIGLTAPKPILKRRIEVRVRQRLRQGALAEVKNLKDVLTQESGAKTILGLAPLQHYLNGKASQEEALKSWTNKEFAYAKRQLTWFKKQTDVNWFDITESDYEKKVLNLTKTWYTRLQ